MKYLTKLSICALGSYLISAGLMAHSIDKNDFPACIERSILPANCSLPPEIDKCSPCIGPDFRAAGAAADEDENSSKLNLDDGWPAPFKRLIIGATHLFYSSRVIRFSDVDVENEMGLKLFPLGRKSFGYKVIDQRGVESELSTQAQQRNYSKYVIVASDVSGQETVVLTIGIDGDRFCVNPHGFATSQRLQFKRAYRLHESAEKWVDQPMGSDNLVFSGGGDFFGSNGMQISTDGSCIYGMVFVSERLSERN